MAEVWDVPTMTGLQEDYILHLSFPGNSVAKNPPVITGSGRCPGEGNGNPL